MKTIKYLAFLLTLCFSITSFTIMAEEAPAEEPVVETPAEPEVPAEEPES
ncbi:MAG: hypothetical protein RIB78_00875 [Gammaproteobacteria bacterium]